MTAAIEISAERGTGKQEIAGLARGLIRERAAMMSSKARDRLNKIFPDIDAIPFEDLPGVIDLVNRTIVSENS